MSLLMAAAAVVVCLPSSARADRSGAGRKRLCVFSVAGRSSGRVRRFLETHLGRHYRLVPPAGFRRAARAVGIRRRFLRPANLRRIARKAGIDAVITVWVARRRARWRLFVTVMDGGAGRTLRRTRLTFLGQDPGNWKPGGALAPIRRAVDSARGVLRRPSEPRRPVPAPRPRVGRRRPAPPSALPVASPRLPSSPPPPAPAASARAGRVARTARPPFLTGVEMSVGVAFDGRYFTINPDRQVVYDSGIPITPVTVEAEVYPAAFFTRHRAGANLGLGFRYQRAFGMVTVRDGTDEEVDTVVQRYGGWLMYRWNVNQTARSPVLYFGVGADVLEFIYEQDLGVLPGVRFVSVMPVIRARFPIGSRVRLGLSASGLGVVSLGQISDREHYGKGSAGGFDAELELGIRIVAGLWVEAGGSTTWLFVKFNHDGTQGTDFRFAADSARDGYYGGFVRVSYAY